MIDVLGSIAVQSLLWDKSVIKSDLCLRNALKTPFSSSQIWKMSKLRHGQNIVPTADLQDQSLCSMCVVVFFLILPYFAYPSPNHQKWMVMVYKVPYLQLNDVMFTVQTTVKCPLHSSTYMHASIYRIIIMIMIYDIYIYIYTRIYIYNYIIIYLYQLYTSSANEEQEITKDNTGSINALL